ncbi:MAG: ATP-binding protein [Butyrivibrio sp.]|nr:ATP-binding protein [Butyrivibrio sp.]
MQNNIRSSYDSFRELRESNSYYVDKSELLEEYLIRRFEKTVLFARPRRFGKTLTMTMFRDFLDIRQDSREIFRGLKVMEYPDVVSSYMNQYPVLFLSLKEIFGDTFEKVFRNFQIAISSLCDDHEELIGSDRVSDVHKEFFAQLQRKEAGEEDTVQAVGLICRMLRDHFGKQVFVIIDEYDVPMAKSLGTSFYDRVRDMIEHMLSYVCKTNDNVKAVMLSGCLYTVKNSTYTGVNNIIPYTVLSPIYASSIGFTDDNVKSILRDFDLEDLYDTVVEWYDGYIFGREKMYCPWDVLLFVKDLLDGTYSSAMGPKCYWLNTSETSLNIIHGFLGKTAGVNESFEKLLAGKTIKCTVKDMLPYHKIHESGENIWSALVETGYLTKAVTEEMPRMPLRIPNREIREVFRREVWDYFRGKVSNAFVSDLENALWTGEVDKAKTALEQILEATLSFYHEYHEYSYHLILDGFFTGLEYRVLSEQETGYGRSDLIILDPSDNRAMILELKHVSDEKEMKKALKEATSQIAQKKYESRLIYDGYAKWMKYGMAFCDKKVLINKL